VTFIIMNLQVPTPTAVMNPSWWEDLEDKIYEVLEAKSNC